MDDKAVKEAQDEQKLYDALASGNEEETARLMAGTEESEDATDVADDTTDTPDEATSDDDAPSDDTATPDEEQDESKDSTGSGDAPPSSKTEAASAAASTEDKLNEELHRLRSDAGRVPYLQRRLQELERQLRAKPARDDKTADTTQDAELPAHLKAKYDAIREVDPDLADALEETAKASLGASKSSSRAEVEAYAKAQEEREDDQFIQQQLGHLANMVPNYREIFSSNEWGQWKQSLTPGRRALAESMYAEEVAQALRAFTFDLNAARQGGSAAQPTKPAPVVEHSEEEKEVQDARKKKIKASADVKPAAAKAKQEFDEEAAFKEQYDAIAKANHIMT